MSIHVTRRRAVSWDFIVVWPCRGSEERFLQRDFWEQQGDEWREQRLPPYGLHLVSLSTTLVGQTLMGGRCQDKGCRVQSTYCTTEIAGIFIQQDTISNEAETEVTRSAVARQVLNICARHDRVQETRSRACGRVQWTFCRAGIAGIFIHQDTNSSEAGTEVKTRSAAGRQTGAERDLRQIRPGAGTCARGQGTGCRTET